MSVLYCEITSALGPASGSNHNSRRHSNYGIARDYKPDKQATPRNRLLRLTKWAQKFLVFTDELEPTRHHRRARRKRSETLVS